MQPTSGASFLPDVWGSGCCPVPGFPKLAFPLQRVAGWSLAIRSQPDSRAHYGAQAGCCPHSGSRWAGNPA